MAAIFGPQTPASAEHIRSITDVAEIPFIDTRWNYHPVNPVLTSNDRNAYTINLHPDVDTVGKSGTVSDWVSKKDSANFESDSFL